MARTHSATQFAEPLLRVDILDDRSIVDDGENDIVPAPQKRPGADVARKAAIAAPIDLARITGLPRAPS